MLKSALKLLAGAVAIVALFFIWRLLPEFHVERVVGASRERVEQFWTDPFFHFGGVAISPEFLIKAIIYLTLLVVASHLGRTFARRRVLERTSIDAGLQYALEVGTGYSIFVIGMIIGLQTVGLNLSSLAFLTGIVGVGVGFGLQNIVSNFVSGLILLVERPIKVGDRVELGGLSGDVVRIAARSTWVRTNDNIVIIVPNSDFITNKVTNWTANDRRVRIHVPLGVGYASEPEKVRALLLTIAASQPEILTDPAPDVIFHGFGESSLDFELRVWTEDSLRTPQSLKSNLYFAIFEKFRESGIEIPFPQRDIYIRSIPEGLKPKD